jgi:hypothetical protein
MHRLLMLCSCLVVALSSCSRPVAPDRPVLGPGDVVRPEIAYAPKEPWSVGAEVALGMLFRVDRSGNETRYLRDDEVNPDQAVMLGRVTFLNGVNPVGDPLEVPFVRDC